MLEVDWLGEISKYLGLIVAAGGGGAAVVFGVFQAWGKGWLDSHFNEKLEAFKHEQAKEIEQVRSRINTMLDRSVRIHQIEFEILPKLWSSSALAYKETLVFCGGRHERNDISQLDEAKLKIQLLKIGYDPSDIDSVLKSTDRNSAYLRMANLRFRELALSSQKSLLDQVHAADIFLSDKLTESLHDLIDIMRVATREAEDRLLDGVTDGVVKLEILIANGGEKLVAIKKHIREDIWSLTPTSSPTTHPTPSP